MMMPHEMIHCYCRKCKNLVDDFEVKKDMASDYLAYVFVKCHGETDRQQINMLNVGSAQGIGGMIEFFEADKEKDILIIGPVGHEELQRTLAKAKETVQNLGGCFGVAEARLMAFAKSEVLKGLEKMACHFICPNNLTTVLGVNDLTPVQPRRGKRFKCPGAKKGSIYDYKKGYVKRSKKDVFRKKI